MSYRKGIYFFILLLIISCTDSNFSGKTEYHPDISLAIANNENIIELSDKNTNSWEETYSLLINDINLFDVSSDDFLIQRMTDVLITENELLILDSGSKSLHRLSFNGEVNEVITGSGRGPGELNEPIRILKGENKYFIADRVNGIHHFDYNNEYITTDHLNILPDNICKLDNYFIKSSYVVLNNGPENHLIFQLDSKGEIVDKYSNRYLHENNMLVFNMAEGPVTCLNSKNLVINSFRFTIPVVEFHFIEKEKSITYHFKDLNPAKIELSNNALQFSNQNLGIKYHQFVNHTILDDRFVINQFREVDRPKDADEHFDYTILSYIIDLTENDFFFSYSIPQILSASKNMIFYKNHDTPFTYTLANFEIR